MIPGWCPPWPGQPFSGSWQPSPAPPSALSCLCGLPVLLAAREFRLGLLRHRRAVPSIFTLQTWLPFMNRAMPAARSLSITACSNSGRATQPTPVCLMSSSPSLTWHGSSTAACLCCLRHESLGSAFFGTVCRCQRGTGRRLPSSVHLSVWVTPPHTECPSGAAPRSCPSPPQFKPPRPPIPIPSGIIRIVYQYMYRSVSFPRERAKHCSTRYDAIPCTNTCIGPVPAALPRRQYASTTTEASDSTNTSPSTAMLPAAPQYDTIRRTDTVPPDSILSNTMVPRTAILVPLPRSQCTIPKDPTKHPPSRSGGCCGGCARLSQPAPRVQRGATE
mgnify:CR=1 FL=1